MIYKIKRNLDDINLYLNTQPTWKLNNIQGPHLTSFPSTHQTQECCTENSVMYAFFLFLSYLFSYFLVSKLFENQKTVKKLSLEHCTNMGQRSRSWHQQADLATRRECQLTTGKCAERNRHDFRCPICRSAIGQASCLICARRRQLTFLFCC